MEYRNDLEAARMRLETLEAKLAEKEAALRARDAEIAEKHKELSRLGQTKRTSPFVRIARPIATHLGVLCLGAFLSAGFFGIHGKPGPAQKPEQTVETIGTVTRGKTGIKDEPPQERGPQTSVEGSAREDEPPQERVPPTSVEGSARENETRSLSQEVEDIQPVVRKHVRACYTKEKEKRSDAGGFVNVVFDVEPTGKVSRVAFGGLIAKAEPWWSKDFESCMNAAYKRLTFHPFPGDKTTARHTYMLSKSDLDF